MVGIGGGIPNSDKGVDIRLGDVVVSQPDGTHGGVVQFDLGKNGGGGKFERKGVLRPPPTVLLAALSNIQSRHQMYGNQISDTVSAMIQRWPRLAKAGYVHPGSGKDALYCGNIEGHEVGYEVGHEESHGCTQCQDGVVDREPREDTSPEVHYGVIVSGNQLMKNAVVRDQLGRELGAKCIEMEAAGLMNDFPCIVIRGICDYADSHKNDVWQEYAAATAAGFATELLATVRPTEVRTVTEATEVIKYNLGLHLFDAPEMGEDLFVGRQAEIRQMESILQPQSDTLGSIRKVLVLGGMGGIGKTQLAITYAQRRRTYYTSIFWLNATSEVGLKTSLRNVARRLLPAETASKLDDEQVCVKVSNWLSEHDNTRWLLVFDNYDDPDLYPISQYYPSAAHGSVMVTTRQPNRVNGVKIKLQSMSQEDDGLRILATRSRRDYVDSDPDARRLVHRLDGHPLALATAGAFLGESAVSFGQYLRRYEARWRVIDSMEELPDYPSRTLYSTWGLSFTQIQLQNPRAAHLLLFLAYFDAQDFWFGLFGAGVSDGQPTWFTALVGDEFVFEDAMRILTLFCLVEAHHQTGSYSLHACVHDWTLDGLNGQIDEKQYWLALDCVASHIGAEDWDDLSTVQYQRLTGHAQRLTHDRFRVAVRQDDSDGRRIGAMVYLAQLLYQQVQYNGAEAMYSRALAWCEKALGPEHTSTLHIVNNLGNLYREQGKLGDAEAMYSRALAGREKALGPKHRSTLDTVHNLGLLYCEQGKLGEAESMYSRALAGREKALGLEHRSTLDSVHNLGNLYREQGKLGEAESGYLRALAGYEKTLGPEHRSTLDTVHNLGALYREQGKLGEAEAMYSRALAGREKALGPEHTSTLSTVHNLGNLYREQGKLGEAESMYLRALAGYEKALGPEHTSTLHSVHNLGNLYYEQGKLGEAESMYSRALAGREKALGPEHRSTLDSVHNLGNLYADQGKLDEAEAMYSRALAGYEKASRSGTIPAFNAMFNMGLLYCDSNQVEEAKTMLQLALAGYETLGLDHTYVGKVTKKLAELTSA